MQTRASRCRSAESSLFTGGSKGVLPVPLQTVEQQAAESAVWGGQEGKGSDQPAYDDQRREPSI
jgi:hypothetical protein